MADGKDTDEKDTGIAAPQPPELAGEVYAALEDKAALAFTPMVVLGLLAGVYISLGGMFATVALAGADGVLPFGVAQVLAGSVFVLGLLLVVVAGAELFTGNTLMVGLMAAGRLPVATLLKAWGIVYMANLVASLVIAAIALAAGLHVTGDGAVGLAALDTAQEKTALGAGTAFASGILANMLVCLAVWMAFSAKTTSDKFFAIFLPIAAFVAAGLEHSVANMYLIPFGWFVVLFAGADFWQQAGTAATDYPAIGMAGLVNNLVFVTLGNIVGGGAVALLYGLAYPQKK